MDGSWLRLASIVAQPADSFGFFLLNTLVAKTREPPQTVAAPHLERRASSRNKPPPDPLPFLVLLT